MDTVLTFERTDCGISLTILGKKKKKTAFFFFFHKVMDIKNRSSSNCTHSERQWEPDMCPTTQQSQFWGAGKRVMEGTSIRILETCQRHDKWCLGGTCFCRKTWADLHCTKDLFTHFEMDVFFPVPGAMSKLTKQSTSNSSCDSG